MSDPEQTKPDNTQDEEALIEELFNPDLFDFSEDFGAKWMKEQAEALANLPDDPWNHWEPMDDDDPVLDYLPNPYAGKILGGSDDIDLDPNDFDFDIEVD